MLAHRIIPVLLAKGSQLVKGQRFQSWRSVGHVEQAARIHASRGVDELIILDISATPEARGPDLKLIERLTEHATTPVTVGGGVRSVEDVKAVLRAGADKVAIGNAAWLSGIVRQASGIVGSQAIVVSCDVVHSVAGVVGSWCMREAASARCQWIESLGAGEILLTSVDREGTMQGYDLDLIRSVSEAVSIPVIAHGGCSGPADMLAAIRAGASACAAGALFQFTDTTPRECAEYLKANGVEARC